MTKSLVIYYSHSGNTRSTANIIREILNADIQEIVPIEKYPSGVRDAIEVFKEDRKSKKEKKIEPPTVDINSYDTIIIGTPNWGGTIAPPLETFLKENDISNKSVLIFATHGGGGLNSIEKDIKKYLKSCEIGKTLVYSGSNVTEKKITNWLNQNN